jgi:hypothetical protein
MIPVSILDIQWNAMLNILMVEIAQLIFPEPVVLTFLGKVLAISQFNARV